MQQNKQRARKDLEKEQRRADILGVGYKLFEERGYSAITMAEVAEQAGLAKGTLYLYFKTKEELFLEVYMQQLDLWFDEVDRLLADTSAAYTIPKFTTIVCSSVQNRPTFLRLLGILHTVLEQNIELETAIRFKIQTISQLSKTGKLLEAHLKFLKTGQGLQTLLKIYAILVGLQQLAEPAPIVQQALQQPGMDVLRINFNQEFLHSVQALLYGLEQKNLAS